MTEIHVVSGRLPHDRLLPAILGREVTLSRGRYGKPMTAERKPIYFNTTHTASLTFLALADCEIGIDAEEIGDYDEAVLPLYFTAAEIEGCRAAGNPKEAFYKLWTQKESYLKYLGTGFHKSPLSVELDPYSSAFFDRDKNCFFMHLIYDRRIAVSICMQKQGEVLWRKLED